MMNLAKRAGRSFGAALTGSLALLASAASCSTGEPTPLPEGSAGHVTGSAGQNHVGAGGSGGGAGMHQGGQVGSGGSSVSSGGSSGGSSALGGSSGSASTGGTGTAGMNSAGTSSAGTGFGAGGSAGTATSGAGGGAGVSMTGGRGGSGGSMNAAGNAGKSSMGGMSGMSSGSAGGGFGANGGVAPPPDISGGSSGWASRYWDCCKPACGWTGNTNGRNPIKSCSQSDQVLSDNNATNACQNGGSAFMCWSDSPWAVGDELSYGFAAASGSNYVCGRCFHLQFDGTSQNGNGMSTQAVKGKHMIVQIINNGGVQNNQFDLLIPGGGVGALNACTTQWGTSDLGAQYGGFLAGCNGDVNCTRQKCQTVFAGKQDLLDGCNWFLGWFGAADNPNFTYKQIACPSDITNKSGLSDPG